MSITLVMCAMEARLPPRDQTVLAQLCWHAKDDGEDCRPSLKRLALRCGCHRTTVLEAIDSLEGGGWVQRVKVCGRQYYAIDVPRLLTLKPAGRSGIAQDRSGIQTGAVGIPDGHLKQSRTSEEASDAHAPGLPAPIGRRPPPARACAQPRAPGAVAPFVAEPHAEFWERLLPTVRRRLEAAARDLIASGVGTAKIVSKLRGQVSPEQVNGWRIEIEADGRPGRSGT